MDTRTAPAQFGGTPSRRYYTGRDLRRVRAIGDLRARAHRLMPRVALEYLEGGAGEEATLARERAVFAEWRFVPRGLVDVSQRYIRAPILGRDAPLPLVVAPTGLNGLFMRHADIALAQGAARAGVPFVQSTMSNDAMEEVARVPGLRHWWQLYVFGAEEIWQALVDRADAAGCEALVLTTNAQQFGRRDWDRRNRLPGGWPSPRTIAEAACHPRWVVTTLSHGLPRFPNVAQFAPKDRQGLFETARWIREQMPRDLSWTHVAKIRDRWKKPFFIKGILHPEDVRRAVDSGADGIILGTHGGRQADWSVTPLDVLPEARRIVGDGIALYLSGGIRSGSDIVKARALGADAVLTGRATLYGLCAHGAGGVTRVIEVLSEEMLDTLGQIGAPTVGAIRADMLLRRDALPLGPGV